MAFSKTEANSWPLIEKLYADEMYKAQYDYYLMEIIGDAFETSSTQMLYDTYSYLVEPYATSEIAVYSFLNGASDFYNAISELKAHASSRNTAVVSYLSEQ